jgi:hypothetical protein
MSRAAYDFQVCATVHSASCGHPGYVPDDYLEHLDGLGIETTITAAELCAIGTLAVGERWGQLGLTQPTGRSAQASKSGCRPGVVSGRC